MDEWMGGWVDGCGWIDKQITRQIGKWIDGQIDLSKWVDG